MIFHLSLTNCRRTLMSYITILSLFIFALLVKNIECNTEKLLTVGAENFEQYIVYKAPNKPLSVQLLMVYGLIMQIGDKLSTDAEQLLLEYNSSTFVENMIHNMCNSILKSHKFIGGFGCTSENDPNGYYNDNNDCVDHLMNKGNTSICRVFYANVVDMVMFKTTMVVGQMNMPSKNIDPSVYCPYIGKTGGNKCIGMNIKR